MKNILITGGVGFIGSNLVNHFLKKKIKVTVIDDLSIGSKKNLKLANISFYKKDIIKINQIPINKRFDALIHLAAKAEILITKEKENIYSNSNIFGLQSVLNFAASRKIKKFIFASSASIYGNTGNKKVNEETKSNPKHFYAYSKYLGEEMVKEYCKINAINFTILRFFNIYGPSSNAVVAKFIAQKAQSKKITIFGNGKQKRDFLHVDDLSRAIYKCLKLKKSINKIYNLGSGKATSILDLKKMISQKKNHIFLPKRNDDIEISISDITKIKKDLNWYPIIDFKNGIKKLIDQEKKRPTKFKLPSIDSQKKLIKKFNKNFL
jgi:UDP-glucose 4-epimerase